MPNALTAPGTMRPAVSHPIPGVPDQVQRDHDDLKGDHRRPEITANTTLFPKNWYLAKM